VLASTGTVGDALDNAMAESFVDSFKTELVRDRAWPSRDQLELAIVEWVGWYNHERLHSSLRDIPPIEYEQEWELAQITAAETSTKGCGVTRSAAPGRPAAPCAGRPDRPSVMTRLTRPPPSWMDDSRPLFSESRKQLSHACSALGPGQRLCLA
jgi:hypothetical protein